MYIVTSIIVECNTMLNVLFAKKVICNTMFLIKHIVTILFVVNPLEFCIK